MLSMVWVRIEGFLVLVAACCALAQTPPSARDYLVSTFAGGLPSATAAPALSYPLLSATGIAVDSAGHIFVSSTWNCVFRIDAGGDLVRVAGNGMAGYSGDGGPALSAQLSHPMGLALDAAGNLYIADSGNGRVREVALNGSITTVAIAASPAGVAVGSAGDLYIADAGGNSIRKASAGAVGGSVWRSPQAVAVDAAGNLYVADTGNNSIRKVSASGIVTTVATGMLDRPGGVAVDGAGNVFIADTGNHAIRKISGGSVETLTRVAGSPAALAVDSSGNIYYADSRYGLVRRIGASGGAVIPIAGSGARPFAGDDGPASLAQFSNRRNRMAIAGGPDGSVYFTDNDNRRVRKVANGTVTSVAGARFDSPVGLAADRSGNLYVADAAQCRVYRIDAAGVVRPFAGSGSCSRLNPYGLALDSAGNLYAADHDNNRIRKISASGEIASAPGMEGVLNRPSAVALDSAGNLYIADTGNRAIRKLAPGGALSTVAEAADWQPEGIAVDAEGRVYFSDAGTNTIREIAADGTVRTIANGPFGDPSDLALDSSGRIFVADRGNRAVRVLVPQGTQPVLGVSIAHAGDFAAGNRASYTLTVGNAALAAASRGTVTVTAMPEFRLPGPPAYATALSIESISGVGWTCSRAACSARTRWPPARTTRRLP